MDAIGTLQPQAHPTLVHFIFGLSDDIGQREFRFSHYLAVRAAHVHLQPAQLLLHCHHLPSGKWWLEAAPLLAVRHVQIPRSRSSAALKHAAHRADILRLELLIAHGGIYLDLDVVVVRSFAPLQAHEFVIAQEGDEAHGGLHGLCNAVLVARPNASFARRWLAEYRTFGLGSGDKWSEHSVHLPSELAAAYPSEVLVLPYLTFFWPDWHENELRQLLFDGYSSVLEHLFPGNSAPGSQQQRVASPGTRGKGFAVHLWSSLSSSYVLSQWSPEYITSVPSGLNCLLQAALTPLPHAPPALGPFARNCSCTATSATSRRAKGAPVGVWPLLHAAPLGGSSQLLLDAGGGCLHGWIYSAGCHELAAARTGLRCWSDASQKGTPGLPPPFAGKPVLVFSRPLEAFVPLHEEAFHPDHGWAVSWWANIHSLHEGCGGSITFWSVSFHANEVSVEVEPALGYLRPVVRAVRGSFFLRRGLAVDDVSLCNNGWHQYVFSIDAPRRMVMLYIDGQEFLSASWRLALSAPRGIWIGGREVLISGRSTSDADSAASHHVDMASLCLFDAALRPDQLPGQCSLRQTPSSHREGWHALPVLMQPQPRWPTLWPSQRLPSLGVDAPCPACVGLARAPTSVREIVADMLGVNQLKLQQSSLVQMVLLAVGAFAVVYIYFCKFGTAHRSANRKIRMKS